jgi:hypothetical protein
MRPAGIASALNAIELQPVLRFGHMRCNRSGEPFDEVERRLGDLAPAVVDRE